MTKLTTHVLDIYSGKPGAGIKVELYYFNNNKRELKKKFSLEISYKTYLISFLKLNEKIFIS